MDKGSSRNDSEENQLIEAIDKLEAFARERKEPPSSAFKTISLVQSIFSDHPGQDQKKYTHQRHPPDKNEVLVAVEWICRNRLFIEKLKEGTPAQQELAEKSTHAVKTYNENCDIRIQTSISAKQRLTQFFSKNKQLDPHLPKITLLKNITVRQHYPEHLAPIKTVSSFFPSEIKVSLSKQSTELFHMKAIVLLERYGIASNREARDCVKASPIYTSVEENTSICTMTQVLSLFPGQTVSVTGHSALDPKTHGISRLFPETFSLSLESTQTGFPHPIQRAGWTMAGQHLPEFPQRLDLLNEMASLLHRKHQTVADLLQQGPLLRHAKELLALKKKCFEKHAQELISLHKKCHLAILNAADATHEAYEIVDRFFLFLQKESRPLETLSDISQEIRENFMIKPHQVLLDSIIKGKSTGLGNPLSEIRFQTSKTILDEALNFSKNEAQALKEKAKSFNDQPKVEYIACLGEILGEASKSIFLQYISEDLVLPPPSLSLFECKVQGAAFLHLKDFLDELSSFPKNQNPEDEEITYQLLKKQILADTALFEKKSPPSISEELSHYFERRYCSLTQYR